MSSPRILIVEDDEAIAAGLQMNLRLEGYDPEIVVDGEEAHKSIQANTFDLVLLDLMLPHRDGLEILRLMRARKDTTPVVVLSAREDEYDKVAALRLGADDYVTKPFALAELLARVAAVLRRSHRAAEHRFSDVVVDVGMYTVERGGNEVSLTPLEFSLLAFLLERPSVVHERQALLKAVWRVEQTSYRTVDNFMAQLRNKLEVDPERPRHFVTVRGKGYRFDP